MQPGGLGRLPSVDVNDHRYLMSAALPVVPPERPKSKTWRIWWKGNQGQTSECVGYSWHALLRAKPHLQRDPHPSLIYREAQKVDEWEGENYDGTSVRAGAKVLQDMGKLLEYRWAFDIETVLNWLAFKGPVVFGTAWYTGMFKPDSSGLILPTGVIEGGHAYVILGYTSKGLLVGQNSWELPWGIKGRFYLKFEDAEWLIVNGGEACTPTEAMEV